LRTITGKSRARKCGAGVPIPKFALVRHTPCSRSRAVAAFPLTRVLLVSNYANVTDRYHDMVAVHRLGVQT